MRILSKTKRSTAGTAACAGKSAPSSWSILMLRLRLRHEPAEAALGPADEDDQQHEERRGDDGGDRVAQPDGHADGGKRPDQGGRGDALDLPCIGEDYSGA